MPLLARFNAWELSYIRKTAGSAMGVYENIRTLVVDPSGHSKTLLRSLLTNLGAFGVEAVSGTDEALAILRTDAFSIVFCDELAGPLDPFAFLRALRTDLATRDVTVPVVLISAGADISKIKAARDCGINDVIVKPVSIGTIDRKLKSLLYPAVPSSALKSGPQPKQTLSIPK